LNATMASISPPTSEEPRRATGMLSQGPPSTKESAFVRPEIRDRCYGVRGARIYLRVGSTRAAGTRETSPSVPWHWAAPSSWVSRVQVDCLSGFKVAPSSCFRCLRRIGCKRSTILPQTTQFPTYHYNLKSSRCPRCWRSNNMRRGTRPETPCRGYLSRCRGRLMLLRGTLSSLLTVKFEQ
jgi:hypothetical protein